MFNCVVTSARAWWSAWFVTPRFTLCVWLVPQLWICVCANVFLCVYVWNYSNGSVLCVSEQEWKRFFLQPPMCPYVCNWNTWVIDFPYPSSQISASGLCECTHLEALGQSKQLWCSEGRQPWNRCTHTHTHSIRCSNTHLWINSNLLMTQKLGDMLNHTKWNIYTPTPTPNTNKYTIVSCGEEHQCLGCVFPSLTAAVLCGGAFQT